PPAGHRLKASVKAYPFRSVDIMIAEDRAFPAAKRVERHRNRNRHINSYHSYFDAIGKKIGRRTIARKNCGSIPILMLIHELDRFLQRADSDDREDRAKDFFAIDPHLRLNMIE